jgi:hypothetical protein
MKYTKKQIQQHRRSLPVSWACHGMTILGQGHWEGAVRRLVAGAGVAGVGYVNNKALPCMQYPNVCEDEKMQSIFEQLFAVPKLFANMKQRRAVFFKTD